LPLPRPSLAPTRRRFPSPHDQIHASELSLQTARPELRARAASSLGVGN